MTSVNNKNKYYQITTIPFVGLLLLARRLLLEMYISYRCLPLLSSIEFLTSSCLRSSLGLAIENTWRCAGSLISTQLRVCTTWVVRINESKPQPGARTVTAAISRHKNLFHLLQAITNTVTDHVCTRFID